MKRIISLAFLSVLFFSAINAQVFNTSSTLKQGQFSAGIEPGVYVSGGSDLYLFLHGGVGIVSGVDLGLKLGIGGSSAYVGADVEFNINRNISLVAGAHSFGDFGLDFAGLVTLPIGSKANFFTGLDLDLEFDDDIDIPLWIPLGLEIPIRQNMLFYFETEIGVLSTNRHFIGGGLSFLF